MVNCELTYRKIPKICPGPYIFQRPFLRGLFLEGRLNGKFFALPVWGLIFGGAYFRNFTVFRVFCSSLYFGIFLRDTKSINEQCIGIVLSSKSTDKYEFPD